VANKTKEKINLISPKTFFAKTKAVSVYDKKVLTQILKKKIISKYLFQCLNGEYEQGITAIQKASLVKNSYQLRLDLGNCFFLKGDYAKSVVVYGQVLGMTKNRKIHSLIYNNLAYAYAKKGFFQQASVYYSQAMKYDKSNQVAKFNQSVMYLQFGKHKKALEIQEKAYQKSKDPYVRQSVLIGMATYNPSMLRLKESVKKNDQLYDGELYSAIVKTMKRKTPQKLKILDGVNNSNLSDFAKLVLENQIQDLKEQIKHEEDRNNIYTRQKARAAGDPK
jgi:tetratricopeptide (TPR) repeat protein